MISAPSQSKIWNLGTYADTHSTFSIHSCKDKSQSGNTQVGRYPEQYLVGCFDELKIVEFYTALEGIMYRQYRDTLDMEWPWYMLALLP